MARRVQMTQSELNDYLDQSVPTPPEESMMTNGWGAEERLRASLQSFDQVPLNRAVDSPQQHIQVIWDGDQKEGIIWYAIG